MVSEGASFHVRPHFPSGPNWDELLNARASLGHLINDTHALLMEDYELIGRFIQSYCIADLEARRVINCLTHIRTGDPAAFALKLNDKDVLEHLIACADCCTWNQDLAEGLRKAAEAFVQHRHFRHMFAHWAGRRVPGHEVFIFFTASLDKQKIPKDALRIEHENDANMQYGAMPISSIREEQVKLVGHSQYLANIASQLEPKASQIAKGFAQDVAEGKLALNPYMVGGGRG